MNIQSATQDDITTRINRTLATFFESSVQKAHTIDPHYGELWENLARLNSAGGKRIRPKIVILAYTAFGGTDIDSIVPIACAQELLHFSMLIHDDIIDRDITRYGVDNISGSYDKLYSPLVSSVSDRMHYANSAAIMAGDLMIAGAHQLINKSVIDDINKTRVQDIMYESIFNVAGGELLDTESSFRPMGAIDPLKITEYKTASYSFVGPFITGAYLAHASEHAIQTLKQLATYLGVAYQLTDDLLGVFGDEAITGKSNTGDIREGKKTYLIEETVRLLNPEQIILFKKYFGQQNASDDDIAVIKDMIITSGAKTVVENKIDDYVQKTYRALDELSFEPKAYAQFDALITKTTKRDY